MSEKKPFEKPSVETVELEKIYAAPKNNKGSNNKNNPGKGQALGHTSAYGKGNNDKWG